MWVVVDQKVGSGLGGALYRARPRRSRKSGAADESTEGLVKTVRSRVRVRKEYRTGSSGKKSTGRVHEGRVGSRDRRGQTQGQLRHIDVSRTGLWAT